MSPGVFENTGCRGGLWFRVCISTRGLQKRMYSDCGRATKAPFKKSEFSCGALRDDDLSPEAFAPARAVQPCQIGFRAEALICAFGEQSQHLLARGTNTAKMDAGYSKIRAI